MYNGRKVTKNIKRKAVEVVENEESASVDLLSERRSRPRIEKEVEEPHLFDCNDFIDEEKTINDEVDQTSASEEYDLAESNEDENDEVENEFTMDAAQAKAKENSGCVVINRVSVQRGGNVEINQAKNAFLLIMNKENKPKESILARDRKRDMPKQGKARKTCHGTNDLGGNFSHVRCNQFPNECFTVEESTSDLYCNACAESVSNKKNSTEVHIRSAKHQKNKEKFLKQSDRAKTIMNFFTNKSIYKESFRGQALDPNVLTERLMVTEILMKSGIPLSTIDDKVSGFRQLLERGCGSLSHRHMVDLIPDIHKIESDSIKNDLRIILSGTP